MGLDLFDTLRKPVGHQARGCFNCKHHTETIKCAKDTGTIWNAYKCSCIAYYDREHAQANLIQITGCELAAELWQKEWEWNGEL